jgi:F-type H+-transporting ATPase subunit alpha
LQEILKQPQYEPVSLEHQVIVLYAGTNGYADQVPLDRMRAWEQDLLRFMDTGYPEIGRKIAEEKRISDETERQLKEALEAFARSWVSA